jgi:hypothetical protein
MDTLVAAPNRIGSRDLAAAMCGGELCDGEFCDGEFCDGLGHARIDTHWEGVTVPAKSALIPNTHCLAGEAPATRALDGLRERERLLAE